MGCAAGLMSPLLHLARSRWLIDRRQRGRAMMGRQRRDQGRLFYEFRLEDRIPENHLLRRMNVFVTAALDDLHKPL
jgi:hypothetical protein